MANRSSSQQWLQRQNKDPFVHKAQQEGFRSRAIYKLQELDQKDRLFQTGQVVVDLGAAPGSWAQYAVRRVGKQGQVIALDILEMSPLSDVTILQGDFCENAVLAQLQCVLDSREVDLVISDMAPNISGVRAVDQPRAMHLAELALEFALGNLNKKGGFVVKVFQGEGFDAFVRAIRAEFKSVSIRKPKSSRPKSREVYLVARHRKL